MIALDLKPLDGLWRKTNEAPQWIDRVFVRIDQGEVMVRVFGSAHPSRNDWGESRALAIYANAPNSTIVSAFMTRYEFDDCEIDVEGNVNLGLLVVATFIRWREGARSDAFTREFFYRADV